MNYLIHAVTIGVSATMVMDVWSGIRKSLFGVALPDYALVGRWVGHMRHGCFQHEAIKAAPRVHGERTLGWFVHYATGVAFAGVLLAVCRLQWVASPSAGPALGIGLATVMAPFLLMQPGMGAGVAGSRTANPTAARVQSIATHTIFGVGLYVGGWLAHYLYW